MAFMSRAQFEQQFMSALAELQGAEKITKVILAAMSRDLLTALHAPDVDGSPRGDIGFINALLGVLTPVNKKVAILFFKEYTGFHFDGKTKTNPEGTDTFKKKNKKGYAQAEEASKAMLEDPHFNIWTWADRHVQVEKKPYDIKAVSKAIAKAMEATEGDQVAVLKAVFDGGITAEGLAVFLKHLAEMPQADLLPGEF